MRPVACASGSERRRGAILLVVLAIVAMLAVLGTTFAYKMRAELSAVNTVSYDLQARLAAESGIQRAILLLRTERNDMDQWYDNEEAFRRIIVWSPGQIGGKTALHQEVEKGNPVWRFSIIAPGEEMMMDTTSKWRYGMVDEAGKLNLNIAPREQLIKLFEQVKPENVTPEELADALIDWRDADDKVGPSGAETSYYMTLNPPYKAKNGPLESIEELLMIKGFNGRILYGEDYNRNGHLDRNEDDSDEGAFPYDNGDGQLNRGIYSYVTVYSRDMNRANDNAIRLNINGSLSCDKCPEEVKAEVEQNLRPEVVQFIKDAKQRGHKFESVAELFGLKIGGESKDDEQDGDPQNNDGRQDENPDPDSDQDADGNRDQDPGQQDNNSDDAMDSTKTPGASDDLNRGPHGADPGVNNEENPDEARDKDLQNRRQARRDGNEGGSNRGGNTGGSGREGRPSLDDLKNSRPDLPDSAFEGNNSNRGGSSGARDGQQGQAGGGAGRDGGRNTDRGGNRDGSGNQAGTDDRTGGEGRGQQGGRNNSGRQSGQAGAGKDGGKKDTGPPLISPVDAADLPFLMDRFTADANPIQYGLINVNTASRDVLMTLPSLTQQDADAIVSARQGLDASMKLTPAWLVTQNAIPPEKFRKIGKYITARSLQYTIESYGFADHVGTFKRLQVVVEMRGQVEQILYWRDISALGQAYPLHEDEWKHEISIGSR